MLYIANAWSELVGEKGVAFFEKNYGCVAGNWLEGRRRLDRPDASCVVLWAPSTSPDALSYDDVAIGLEVHAWVLYPVALLGWSDAMNDYEYRLSDTLCADLRRCRSVLANSAFTAAALNQIGLTSCDGSLWIDWGALSVQQAVTRYRPSTPVVVHWNHQWRSDKNVLGAIDGMIELARQLPQVQFVVGRCLDGVPDVGLAREAVGRLRRGVRENLHVMRSFKDRARYHRFLRSVSLSVSVSHEESFGLAMLEAASSGCACVVPNRGNYVEVLPSAVTGRRDEDVWDQVSRLCQASVADRMALGARCRAEAAVWDVSVRVPRLIAAMKEA